MSRRYGSETPRIFTPPLRPLTAQTSLGFAAVEFAGDVCGIDLFPWERWFLVHALELDPALTVDTLDQRGPLDPVFRFRVVVMLVARQNGKSLVSQILALFFMYVLGTRLILGTAQDLDTAEEVWDGALGIIEDTPELAVLADKPVRVNGKKTIRLLTGERYKVKAANRRAGRGLSGDLIMLDELREHQTWDAWAAIAKTTQARPAAMILVLSNAGDASSVVLAYLRRAAHAALGDPDGVCADHDPAALLPSAAEVDDLEDLSDEAEGAVGDVDMDADPDSLGIFEWSAPPGCAREDRAGWAAANPSLGWSIAERTIAGDARRDPDHVFRNEVLCQWTDTARDGPFPPGTWEAGTDPGSTIPDEAPVVYGLDVSTDRTRTHVAAAGRRADGLVHVEIVASRAGTDWPVGWFGSRASEQRPMTVAVQARGAPASSLMETLASVPHLNLVEVGGPDLGNATARIFDLVAVSGWNEQDGGPPVRDGLVHLPQPVLDVAAAVAVPKILDGGGMAWDRKKSPVDIAPLVAATFAVWAADRPAAPLPRRSAYETADLMVLD